MEWDSKHQKEIFKGTFWSSVATALLSGYVTDRTSPKWLLQLGIAFYIICTAVFPWLTLNVGYTAALLSRIVMGIGEVKFVSFSYNLKLIEIIHLFLLLNLRGKHC